MGGGQYVKKYPKNRILKTLINFDIAVLLYLLLNILIGKEYPISEIILSFTGVTGIGTLCFCVCKSCCDYCYFDSI